MLEADEAMEGQKSITSSATPSTEDLRRWRFKGEFAYRPSGGMADARDLKSLVPLGTCGFESRLGHWNSRCFRDLRKARCTATTQAIEFGPRQKSRF